MFHISTQRPILCSHSSSQIPILHSMYPLSWNTLPYIGKFDGQTAFGVYGLAATYTIPTKLYNPVATHTPYNAATADLRLRPVYGYGQSTVAATLRLRPIYGYGQYMATANLRFRSIYGCGHSTVAANLRLRTIYGYGQSTVTVNLRLWPLYFVTTASLPITVTVMLYLDYMHFQSATLVQ